MLKTKGKILARRFDLDLSMKCGQVFGWDVDAGWYYGFIDSVAVAISQRKESIVFEAEKPLDPLRISEYFGVTQDFDLILKEITIDEHIARIVKAVGNLRILKQDPWTCLCAFILSSNNRVERIDQVFKTIACRFGVRRSIRGHTLYRWPEPSKLALQYSSELRECGAGFRADYIIEAAKAVAGGKLDLVKLGNLSYEQAKARLMEIKGVGEKIADCVLLFAYARYEAFPVDVWIKRAVEEIYFGGHNIPTAKLGKFGRSYFGRYAGYAQEYIYYYARRFMTDP
ncbi:MAG: DNA-3-methyladenine glycosylase family protein [bacterium]